MERDLGTLVGMLVHKHGRRDEVEGEQVRTITLTKEEIAEIPSDFSLEVYLDTEKETLLFILRNMQQKTEPSEEKKQWPRGKIKVH